MQPTMDTDLRLACAAIERLVNENGVSEAAVGTLTEVARSLRRLARTSGQVLPYLIAENRSTSSLLVEVGPLVPALAGEIAALEDPLAAPHDASAFSVDAINDLHDALRDLLARAITALPEDEDGAAARRRIKEHLLRTLDLRPW